MIQSKLQQLQEMLSTNSSTRKSTRKLETVIVTEGTLLRFNPHTNFEFN